MDNVNECMRCKLAYPMRSAVVTHVNSCMFVCSVPRFNKFDQVLVLATGKTVYYGTPQGLGPYCTKLGYDIPANTNPAEFMCKLLCKSHTREHRR